MHLRKAATAASALVMGVLTACGSSSGSSSPETTVVNDSSAPSIGIGLESVTRDTDWDAMREQFDEHRIPGFSISVGRPEWNAMPVGAKEDRAPIAQSGEDVIGKAIDKLSRGSDRVVVTTIDALTPRWNGNDPELAGMFANGRPASDFPSARSLYSGPAGEGITAMCRAAAERYEPDRIAITELLGDTFFSDSDEELFEDMTGADGFPRLDDGEIDTEDERLQEWQSTIVTSVVTRCQEASGVPVELDVRVNWVDPGSDRSDSGHRYDELLETGAHLTLWAYTGTGGVEPELAGELVEGLRERYGENELERITVSVGLWGDGDEVQSPDTVRRSLDAIGSGPRVLLTPLSLMEEAHWDLLNG